MVLAMSLPAWVEQRELIVHVTYGVVVLSILGQGLTMAPLLRWLKVGGRPQVEQTAFEEQRAQLRIARRALDALAGFVRDGRLTKAASERVRADYAARVALAEDAVTELRLARKELEAEEERAVVRQLLLLERAELLEARDDGHVSYEVFRRLLADVDARIVHGDDRPLDVDP